VRGVEANLIANLARGLTAHLQYSHQNGESSGIPAEAGITAGVAPQGTVPNTYIAALEYVSAFGGGQLAMRMDYTHKDRYNLEFNDTPQFFSEVDGLVNARVAYRFPNERLELALWGKNLTDEDIVIYGQDFWFAYYDTASFLTNPAIAELTAQPRYADPRTWGVSFLYRH
jgi:iron complex outermembrane recepter protein